MAVAKYLDIKLARIKSDPRCRDFIIADAKDADMAYGIAAPGKSPEMHAQEGRFRTLAEYRECIREVVRQGVVDVVLMSAHTSGILAIEERLFDDSPVTPAARANDTTDIFVARGGHHPLEPARPFRTATLDHLQCGHLNCTDGERARGVDLGLYSITFNNDAELDRQTLEAYREFRLEAEQRGFRHFLEVFNPNAPRNPIDPAKLGGFVNDMIIRCLAGVPEAGRPLFLKIVYNGPRAMEELVRYDPTLVVGVLGGGAGTTADAFVLLHEAQKHGARVALFGRKINNSEHQLAFITMMRKIVDGEIAPLEAVRAYHGILQGLNIRPVRSLEEDLKLTDPAVNYAGTSAGHAGRSSAIVPGLRTPVNPHGNGKPNPSGRVQPNPPGRVQNRPDLAKMTSAERTEYHRRRLRGVTG